MSQIFTIESDKVVITSLAAAKIDNTELTTKTLQVTGNAAVSENLSVSGTISVGTLHAKTIVTESGATGDVGNWIANTEDELAGKGLNWTWGNGHLKLAYQYGNRLLLSGGNLDLAPENSYRIDNTEVITLNSLGPTVTKSNLKEVGTLKSLNVTGDSLIGEFAYFSSGFGRLGLNTDEPNGALSIVENDVEVVIGSPDYGVAQLGTYTTHDLSIITDNTSRITVKNDGKVIFGDAASKTANVTIYGTLNVETLVADTRVERFSSLEIKSSKGTNIYGKGIVWTGAGTDRQFVMLADPERLWSTESIDLAGGQGYFINCRPVLTEESLGDSVIKSNLSSVGTLDSLTVKGETNLSHTLSVATSISAPDLVISKNSKTLLVSGTKLGSDTDVSVNVLEDEVFYADANEISIGNKRNTRKPVKLFGPVSVGVATPDLDADFTVKGSVKFSGKKFITGSQEPTEGSFNKGDICWNENPVLHGYVGWVCTVGGVPGTWIPFGAIGR